MNIRWGLWGAGAFGTFLAQTLLAGGARVTALASRTRERVASAAQRTGVMQTFTSLEELAAFDDVDAVIIATPPSGHADDARVVIDAHKHVLVEKPLAIDPASGRDMIARARGAGVVIAVDHPMRYLPTVDAIVALAESGVLGRPLRVDVGNIASCEGLDDDHWFWNPQLSGGIFIEHAVHFFDWIASLLPPPEVVVATTARHGNREDVVAAIVAHRGGAVAHHLHAFVTTPARERTRTTIAFERADVMADGWLPLEVAVKGEGAQDALGVLRTFEGRHARLDTVDDIVRLTGADKPAAYAASVQALVGDVERAIREPGHTPRSSAARALAAVELADAARRAAKTSAGQTLSVPNTGPIGGPS